MGFDAIGINQVIGSAVFALPAALAASAGPWSPWLVAAVGVASMLMALSFAEVASRFDSTGGAIPLYPRRVQPLRGLRSRVDAVVHAGCELGGRDPCARRRRWGSYCLSSPRNPRAILITAIIAGACRHQHQRIRQSSFVLNVLTVGKLAAALSFHCRRNLFRGLGQAAPRRHPVA